MKQIINILFFGMLAIHALAQPTIDQLLSLKEEKEQVYKPQIPSGRQLYLNMAYGCSTILNPQDIAVLKGATIASIDVVYSDHLKDSNYPVLTRKRLENLKRISPALFNNKSIKWSLVRQTSCHDRASAEKLFHGIVITYRPAQSKEEMEKEKSYLEAMLSKPTRILLTDTTTRMGRGEKEYILSDQDIFYDDISYLLTVDSTVSSVLKRNKWTNMIIASDLTGSMSPYTAQLLLWFKLNTTNDKVKQFVFFNDGDATPDEKKIIGNTGGIYATRSSTFKDVEALALQTMTNGGGGDIPENDIEALMKAMELCPEGKDIVLIADNWAPIKDISLASKIKKPIKIILCGADYGMNVQYLNFARATGGSVHTMTNDLTQLVKMNEGQELTFGRQLFKIEKGKFVEIKKV